MILINLKIQQFLHVNKFHKNHNYNVSRQKNSAINPTNKIKDARENWGKKIKKLTTGGWPSFFVVTVPNMIGSTSIKELFTPKASSINPLNLSIIVKKSRYHEKDYNIIKTKSRV